MLYVNYTSIKNKISKKKNSDNFTWIHQKKAEVKLEEWLEFVYLYISSKQDLLVTKKFFKKIMKI